MFFMRTREDISAKDGRLVLFEYAEEHPLLMSCIGMASRIKNYSKKGINGDPVNCDHLKYGDQVYNTSPYFLGKLHPGQVLQVQQQYSVFLLKVTTVISLLSSSYPNTTLLFLYS